MISELNSYFDTKPQIKGSPFMESKKSYLDLQLLDDFNKKISPSDTKPAFTRLNDRIDLRKTQADDAVSTIQSRFDSEIMSNDSMDFSKRIHNQPYNTDNNGRSVLYNERKYVSIMKPYSSGISNQIKASYNDINSDNLIKSYLPQKSGENYYNKDIKQNSLELNPL